MNALSRFLFLAATLAAGVSAPVLAQPSPPTAQAEASPAAGATTEGEVRRVDKSTSKISLKHGEIRSLDMPPMTMVFQVQDPAVLDKVKVGDKVRFIAERVNGVFTVTSLEVVP